MYIRKFTYSAEDVDCNLCTEYTRKIGCRHEVCPFLAERIEAGVVSYQSAVKAMIPRRSILWNRLSALLQNYPGYLWADSHHKTRMELFNHQLGYKDNADTIIGNMDTSIFLGGKEPTTLKELSAALGKETIDTFNTGESRGREVSHSLNYQKLGKELMSQDELAVMDGGKCVLQLRGVRPFLSNKYDITKHPNYKYTSDFDKRNELDIERFLSRRLKLKPDQACAVYDFSQSE